MANSCWPLRNVTGNTIVASVTGDYWSDLGDRIAHYDNNGNILEVMYKSNSAGGSGTGGLHVLQTGSPILGGYSAFPAPPAPDPPQQFVQSMRAENGDKQVDVKDTDVSDRVEITIGSSSPHAFGYPRAIVQLTTEEALELVDKLMIALCRVRDRDLTK